jgi:hypothetical protein
MTNDELKLLARELTAARIIEAMPTKEKVAETIVLEVRRQAWDVYSKEARQMTSECVQQEIRRQLRIVVQEWIDCHVPDVLASMKPDTAGLEKLVMAEIDSVKQHVVKLVREETLRLVQQAIGAKIGEKVAKLLSLFDKVLVQD